MLAQKCHLVTSRSGTQPFPCVLCPFFLKESVMLFSIAAARSWRLYLHL